MQKKCVYEKWIWKWSLRVVNELGFILLKYNGDINIFNQMIENIIKKYPLFENLIKNDFIINIKNILLIIH